MSNITLFKMTASLHLPETTIILIEQPTGTEPTTIQRHTALHLLLVSMVTFCVISVISNALVIFTIAVTKQLRHVASVFIVNLAVVDVAIAVLIQPSIVAGIMLGDWTYNQAICNISALVSHTLMTSSVLTVAAISIDRYLAIIHCLQYSMWNKSRYAAIVLVWIWTQSATTGIFLLLGSGNVQFDVERFWCSIRWNCNYSLSIFVLTVNFVIPCLVVLFSYVRVIYITRSHNKRIAALYKRNKIDESHINVSHIAHAVVFTAPELSFFNCIEGSFMRERCMLSSDEYKHTRFAKKRNLMRELTAAGRLILFFVALVCLWFPYFAANIQQVDCDEKMSLPGTSYLSTLSLWLAMLSSSSNPFLYSLFSMNFRRALKRLSSPRVRPIDSPNHARSNVLSGRRVVSVSHFETALDGTKPHSRDKLKWSRDKLNTIEHLRIHEHDSYQNDQDKKISKNSNALSLNTNGHKSSENMHCVIKTSARFMSTLLSSEVEQISQCFNHVDGPSNASGETALYDSVNPGRTSSSTAVAIHPEPFTHLSVPKTGCKATPRSMPLPENNTTDSLESSTDNENLNNKVNIRIAVEFVH